MDRLKTTWEGHYLDGQTSASKKAEIHPLAAGLSVRLEDGGRFLWSYEEIQQIQGRYEGEPVRLERGGDSGEALIIQDTDLLTAMRELSPAAASRFHDPGFRGTRKWLTFYAAIATVVVGLSLYHWGIPFLANLIAPRVPISWEKGLGKSELDIMAPAEKRILDARLNRVLGQILSRLAATVPHCPYRFEVTVVDLPIVNAFALPGGSILVYRELLETTQTPEELAGVLAHEMQHVLKRHTTKRLIQDSSTALLISALSGDATGSAAFALQSAGKLALLEYSREEEEEADREGMKMILAAGINPQGMIRFFRTIEGKGKEPEFLKFISTHPATADRIQKLKAIVAATPNAPAPRALLPGTDWKALIRETRRLK
ncbi:MAG TPA: M48 family metallopeptidase [bacterium]|nr:M48 family metallopeptidase [bacterium]